jgi:hypothetical protein
VTVIAGCALLLVEASHSAPKPSESEAMLERKTVSHIKPLRQIPYRFLVKVGNRAIHAGHVYSHRWGDASPWLKAICYEMVDRAFSPYGTHGWARHVVNRESGCNPAAINSSSGTTGIAQIHPGYHTWVDFRRVQWDMGYALKTFLRLSRNGQNTGPWCLC